MRYSEFIDLTISNKNEIKWNYYSADINTKDILMAKQSKNFIRRYFAHGEKMLPLLLNPITSEQFIFDCSSAGQKEYALSFNFDEQYQLPDERAIHTISGFFLGLLIENCLTGTHTLAIENENYFPFAYLWFLTFLYHDYGYCVTERDDCPIRFPRTAPIPTIFACQNKISLQEYDALSKANKALGIDISPYSHSLNFSSISYHKRDITPSSTNSIHDILRRIMQCNNSISKKNKLNFNSGIEIDNHWYPSRIITRYFNYRINEMNQADHGIIGGYLFYDRMVKNYALAYMSLIQRTENSPNLEDFKYNHRHFCIGQLSVFSYITDCILVHNIWKQSDNSRELYERYLLKDLFAENYKIINFDKNPILYILTIADSLEPTKTYKDIPPLRVVEAIDIDYQPASRVLKISSRSKDVDIRIMYKKAKDLEDWTSVRCSDLINGKFSLYI